MAANLHSLRTRPRRTVRPKRRANTPAPSAPPESAEVARHRRAGGPEDVALYTCGCGYAFEATVTASVDCPHCGADQAW